MRLCPCWLVVHVDVEHIAVTTDVLDRLLRDPLDALLQLHRPQPVVGGGLGVASGNHVGAGSLGRDDVGRGCLYHPGGRGTGWQGRLTWAGGASAIRTRPGGGGEVGRLGRDGRTRCWTRGR